MLTIPLGISGNSLSLSFNKIPNSPSCRFPSRSPDEHPLSHLSRSGICKASQMVELFPTLSPEIVVREARMEDCWEVAETHCSSFFPEYSFPLDFMLRIDRLFAMVMGSSVPNGCRRTCLVAVTGSSEEDTFFIGSEDLKIGGFDGKFSLNKGYVTGILTVDTVADFLPRKGPLRQRRCLIRMWQGCYIRNAFSFLTVLPRVSSEIPLREPKIRAQPFYMWNIKKLRTGIAYLSNVAVRERYRRKGIAKKLIVKAESQAKSWGCRAIALHCDLNNPGAVGLYKGQGFKSIKVPEGAKWPQPKTSPDIQFNFMMKILNT